MLLDEDRDDLATSNPERDVLILPIELEGY